jgi:hypothetical protein
MNDPHSTPAMDSAYAAPDELLRDLRGDNGAHAQALAVGYAMAMHDADADSWDGATLQKNLRGEGGEALRLSGLGYVMAVRDALTAASGAGRAIGSPRARAGGPADAEIVLSWLKRHPSAGRQSALSVTRRALRATTSPRRRVAEWLAECLAAPVVAKAAAFATLCLATALAWQSVTMRHATRDRAFEQSVELSQRAARITSLLLEERRFEKDSFINIADRSETEAYAGKWEAARALLADTIARTYQLDLGDSDRRAMREIETDFQAYVDGYRRVLQRIQRGEIRTAQDANRELADYKGAVHRIETVGAAINARAVRRLGILS